jgi:hypothetical protein
MEIIVVELDSGAEVTGAELVGGMDLGSAPTGGWNAATMRGASVGRGAALVGWRRQAARVESVMRPRAGAHGTECTRATRTSG